MSGDVTHREKRIRQRVPPPAPAGFALPPDEAGPAGTGDAPDAVRDGRAHATDGADRPRANRLVGLEFLCPQRSMTTSRPRRLSPCRNKREEEEVAWNTCRAAVGPHRGRESDVTGD